MKMNTNLIRSLLLLFIILPQTLFAQSEAATSLSAQKDYEAKRYTQAAEKYQKIVDSLLANAKTKEQNEDLLLNQYNLARCLDKAGQYDKAIELYLIVAGAQDKEIALRAKYDLGCLYAHIANLKTGQNPNQLESDKREEVRSNINNAVSQWRAILNVTPDYSDVTQKLERILTISQQWEDSWKTADLKKNADKKKALEYAVDVENEILKTYSAIKRLGLKEDSLVTRQDYFQMASQQSDTIQKAEILLDKTLKALEGQESTDEQSPTPSTLSPQQKAQVEQIKPIIEKWIKDSQSSLEKSAQELYNRNSDSASGAQKESYQTLDNVFLSLSTLQDAVSRAIKQQKDVIAATEKRIKKTANKDTSANADKTNQDAYKTKLDQIRLDEHFFSEDMILPWTQTIVPKAKAMLAALPPDQKPGSGSNKPAVTLNNSADNLQEALDALQQPDAASDTNQSSSPEDQQMQKIRKMCNTAIELGPKIPPLIEQATQDIKNSQLEQSLTSQKEALRLLEEILKDDSQQDQKQDQNQDKNQNKDQNQDNQNNKDKNKQNQEQDKNKQEQNEQEKSEQEKQEEQDKQDQQNKQDQSEKEEENNQQEEQAQEDEQEKKAQQQAQKDNEELTDAQARGLMRRVQARQDEKKKLEAQLRRAISPPEQVEKDW